MVAQHDASPARLVSTTNGTTTLAPLLVPIATPWADDSERDHPDPNGLLRAADARGSIQGGAEEAAAAARLAAIVRSSHDAIIGKDLEDSITSWNPGAQRLYGWAAHEILGRPSRMLVAPESRDREATMIASTAAGERTKVFRSRRMHKDGTVLDVSLSLSPIVDADGRIIGVASASRDVGELVAAEARYQALLEAAPDGMVCADADGVITLVNAQLERLTGYSREELIGRPVELLVPVEAVERHPGLRAGYVGTPTPRAMGAGAHLHARRKDGSTFPADISLSSADVNGQITVTAAIRDVSDRISDREALRVSESRLRELAENINIGFILGTLDPPGFLYISPAVKRIYGFDALADGIPGGTLASIHPLDRERAEVEHYAPALAGEYRKNDFRIVRPDGEIRWVQLTNTPITDPDGVVRRMAATVEDITDRKTMEIDIARRAELTRRMEELAEVGAWAVELPSMELTWSAGVYRIHDIDPNRLPTVADALTYYPPETQLKIQTAIANGQSWDLESPFATATGRERWIRAVGAPVVENGTVVRLVGAFQDITEIRRSRVELEALNTGLEDRVAERTTELESSNLALQAANRELEAFSYSVSHDLRAPLRAILGFSQILTRRHRSALDEKGQHFLDNIVTAGQRMGRMIDDLLEYSRLSSALMPTRPIDMAAVMAEMVETFQDRVESMDAELLIAPGLATPLGDRTLIDQVLTNLIDNALTYHCIEGRPRIEISVQPCGDEVVLRVADNGIGIPAEFHEKVFQAFQRLHTADAYPGSGIGLASVQKAVSRMNGRISLTSTPGVGSVFAVHLPAALSPTTTTPSLDRP